MRKKKNTAWSQPVMPFVSKGYNTNSFHSLLCYTFLHKDRKGQREILSLFVVRKSGVIM